MKRPGLRSMIWSASIVAIVAIGGTTLVRAQNEPQKNLGIMPGAQPRAFNPARRRVNQTPAPLQGPSRYVNGGGVKYPPSQVQTRTFPSNGFGASSQTGTSQSNPVSPTGVSNPPLSQVSHQTSQPLPTDVQTIPYSALQQNSVASQPVVGVSSVANTKSPTPLGLSPTPDATMNSGSQVVTVSSNEFNTENPRLGFVTNRNADPNHLNSVLGKEPGGKVVVPSQPSNQPNPPTTVGRHLNLLPHETASERLLKLMDVLAEKDRQIESLSLQETGLNELIRQKDEKLQAAAREIRQARRDVANAQEQLDQLKQSVRSLHEKVQTSERENAEVLRTLTPLLQQLLNDEDEVAPMPTQVSEKPE